MVFVDGQVRKVILAHIWICLCNLQNRRHNLLHNFSGLVEVLVHFVPLLVFIRHKNFTLILTYIEFQASVGSTKPGTRSDVAIFF